MEINPETLLNIIGRQQVEITMLRDQVRSLHENQSKGSGPSPTEAANDGGE